MCSFPQSTDSMKERKIKGWAEYLVFERMSDMWFCFKVSSATSTDAARPTQTSEESREPEGVKGSEGVEVNVPKDVCAFGHSPHTHLS